MKRFLNYLITVIAVVGVIVMFLAINKMDYMVDIGANYPLSSTIKTIVLGALCILPSAIRRYLVWREIL